MKNITGILVLIATLFCACGNRSQNTELPTIQERQQNTTLSYVEEAENLNSLLRTFDKPMQRFRTTSKKKTTVTGELGTIVHVDPANLETFDGQPLGETIDVELKEYSNQVELLRGNVATICNGEMIISGGAYWLDMTSDGKPLRIKQGKNIEVEFPKFAEEEMELFYGQRDSLGQMNWTVAEQRTRFQNRRVPPAPAEIDDILIVDNDEVTAVLSIVDVVIFDSEYEGVKKIYSGDEKIKKDTVQAARLTQEELETLNKQRIAELEALKKQREKEIALWKKQVEMRETMYQAMEITQLGWINCDRFFGAPRTQLLIALNESTNIPVANVFLVFKDVNGVMQRLYYKQTGTSFNDVPVGYNVRMIAFGVDQEGETYTYSSDFKIEKNDKRTIDLKKSSKEELAELLTGEWL